MINLGIVAYINNILSYGQNKEKYEKLLKKVLSQF
jgi:hypothetical protein